MASVGLYFFYCAPQKKRRGGSEQNVNITRTWNKPRTNTEQAARNRTKQERPGVNLIVVELLHEDKT
jgi:hypothetical protein